MGLSSIDLDLIIALKAGGAIGDAGAVMEIGAQQLSNAFLRARRQIDEIGRRYGAKGRLSLPGAPHIDAAIYETMPADAPRSAGFWRWLGFDYASIDIDGSPGAIPLDLNYDDAPPDARGRYDIVVNAGTTEHVANQVNAFKVVHDLTRVGGVMIHHVPAQGMANHGLVNYNPKFFWMLGRSNGYDVVHFAFNGAGHSRPVPDDIVAESQKFGGDASSCGRYEMADASIVIAMRKRFDVAFVAPIDVNTGARTADARLRDRYWTVFEPEAFETMDGVVRREAALRARELAVFEREQAVARRERMGLGALGPFVASISPGLGIGRAVRRAGLMLRR